MNSVRGPRTTGRWSDNSNEGRMSTQKYVDAAFPARGKAIPVDHGYALFSALSRHLPHLHQRRTWAVHPVFGDYQGRGILTLNRRSMVKLRLPADDLAQILGLGGSSLTVREHAVHLGFPRIYPLETRPHLESRLVAIKGFGDTPDDFARAVARQLTHLDDLGQSAESIDIQVGPRRVLRIKQTPIAGHALALSGLSAQASLTLQCRGLGGRRHMGAGVFVPPGRKS